MDTQYEIGPYMIIMNEMIDLFDRDVSMQSKKRRGSIVTFQAPCG